MREEARAGQGRVTQGSVHHAKEAGFTLRPSEAFKNICVFY